VANLYSIRGFEMKPERKSSVKVNAAVILFERQADMTPRSVGLNRSEELEARFFGDVPRAGGRQFTVAVKLLDECGMIFRAGTPVRTSSRHASCVEGASIQANIASQNSRPGWSSNDTCPVLKITSIRFKQDGRGVDQCSCPRVFSRWCVDPGLRLPGTKWNRMKFFSSCQDRRN
jgi:hypothetical protein